MMPPVEGNTLFEQEIAALKIADGDGYVLMLNDDTNYRAVLLERLGPPLKDMDYSAETQIEIICNALKRSWAKPLPKEQKLQSGEDMIKWFLNFIAV